MDIRKIAESIIINEKYQPGYPRWDKLQELKKKRIKPQPGMQPGVTWCNEAANEILVESGYNTLPLLDKKYQHIGYTDANEMYSNAMEAAAKGIIREVSAEEAQDLANQEIPIPVLVAAPGDAHGHVAVVMPCSHVYNPAHGCFIAQAGSRNGFFYVNEIFKAPWVYPDKIKYFVLNLR